MRMLLKTFVVVILGIAILVILMMMMMITKLLIIQVLHELTAAGLYVDCEVDKDDDNHNLRIIMTS